jgi:hypothetical protein
MATGPIDEPARQSSSGREPEDTTPPLGGTHDQTGPEPEGESAGESTTSDRSQPLGFAALRDAAVEAEFATGKVEDTVQEAKRHILVRMARIFAGVVVTLIGIALLALPGPGLVVMAIGLALLAQDVPFARRLLDRVEERLPKDSDGKIPKSMIVMMTVTAVVFTGARLWFAFVR